MKKRVAMMTLVLTALTALAACGSGETPVMKQVQIGDTVSFGTYEQDNIVSNGPEDIEWIVLDRKDKKALLISKHALDCKPYNTVRCDITWETCSLRKWLNNDFLNAAFSVDEQEIIPVSSVYADKNPEYRKYPTNPGNATQDKVFLLSILETYRYFASDKGSACEPTAYAAAMGASTYEGNCCWWLRSPGILQDLAAYAFHIDNGCDGPIGSGCRVGDYLTVRPALWVNLES